MPKEYKDAIKVLNKSNKDLIKKQKQLDSSITVYESEIKKLDFKINNIKEKTTIIKEYYTQQGTAADSYTPTQVDSFFKARYNY